MATYSERRSLSLESVSIATSLSSFDENPETSPSIPNIMIPEVQGASRGDSVVDWIQGELKDWLHERDRMRTVPPRDDGQLKSVEASHAPTDTYPMHERFCFPTDNIYFLVNGVLYSVHRYFFERDSSSFTGQGLSRREPMVLTDISMRDLDLFLSILYPSSFGLYSASTVDEWSSILHLADKWSFESIRVLAITQLTPIASPIDKIVLGGQYGVNEWLPDAYGTVCVQPAALTLDEGRRLGVDDVIRINAIRQEFCFLPVCMSSLTRFSEVQEQVELRFELTVQTPPFAPVEPLSDAEELGPNGKPLSKVMLRKRQKEREAKEKADQEAKERDEAEKADVADRSAEEERATEEQRMASTSEPESASFEPEAAPEPPTPEPTTPAVEAPPADELGPNGKPLSKIMLRKRQKEREAREKADQEAKERDDQEAKERDDADKAYEAERAAEDERAAEEQRQEEEEDYSFLTPKARKRKEKEREMAQKERAAQELEKQFAQQMAEEARAAEEAHA